ncbi:helix-turn-helix domain-containing protein [Novosphingobium taihuense]|uniref:DNA-binding CsgD family transcriptional regulator n=1 Tax=Novosphingobium taihuense TaxID=260085 RepID=A0A7W7AGP0_9SPHN|nr:helix-turn-helix transcriptional regulator [Novosphingobium taihuense]MBB4615687.1 DNA-binding CsgD family transcriptional regulator [Novosphingobium taihuense]
MSEKQREVLDLVLDRRTNKEIAAILGISPSAVEQRLQSVRRRLGVVSRADLARTYQDLLNACQNLTGEKLQVAEKSLAVQPYDGDRTAPALNFEAEQAVRSGGGQVGARSVGNPPVGMTEPLRGSGLLAWLDRIAGMPGRIAAITVTATSLAFLLAIATRLADAGR